jgi:hypothetical protein
MIHGSSNSARLAGAQHAIVALAHRLLEPIYSRSTTMADIFPPVWHPKISADLVVE